MAKRTIIFATALALMVGAALLLWNSSDEDQTAGDAQKTAGSEPPSSSGRQPRRPNPTEIKETISAKEEREEVLKGEFEPLVRSATLVAKAVKLQQESANQRAINDSSNALKEAAPKVVYTPDREGIRDAVRSLIPELRECYEPWAQLNETLGGQIKVRFQIGSEDEDTEASGDNFVFASGAKIEGDIGEEVLNACVMQTFGSLAFERREGTMNVTYPLNFANESEE